MSIVIWPRRLPPSQSLARVLRGLQCFCASDSESMSLVQNPVCMLEWWTQHSVPLQPFCWLCGAATGTAHDYSRIVGHECGRYKEDADAKAASASRWEPGPAVITQSQAGNESTATLKLLANSATALPVLCKLLTLCLISAQGMSKDSNIILCCLSVKIAVGPTALESLCPEIFFQILETLMTLSIVCNACPGHLVSGRSHQATGSS